MVTISSMLSSPRRRYTVSSGPVSFELDDLSETANVDVNVSLLSTSGEGVRTAVLFPANDDGSQLPVLLDPYGGPHAQRVLASYNAFTASQWFADQGFVVIVADGRARQAGVGAGSDRYTVIWQRWFSRTRSRHSNMSTNSTLVASTCRGSRFADGHSVGISQRSP